ncbi:DMT family transporter [Agitococcus lubricus]|uniref:Threonine/homoserine efflux transporter RhtA n=1 Tax=Agitococcus lubricus TaxID=1077255 RepID=A0A2T5J2X8_9GAMM|nr:DMT family transporter [Agitococcus lubricus]PTQ90970.1 threonine/homoserine efflux transporter RhtA [Agitococcus lubricus]
MNQTSRQQWIGYGLVLFTLSVWASFILVSRLAGKSVLTPWDTTALRFGTAAIVLLPYVLWKMEIRQFLNWRYLVVAILGGLGYAMLAYVGFSLAPAAHGAIFLHGFLPFWTAFMGWLLVSEAMTRDRWLGLSCIAFGIGAMAFLELQNPNSHFGWGDVMFAAASASWAAYTALLKRWQLPPIPATVGVAIISALLFLPIYWLFLPSGMAQASWSVIALQAGFQGILVVIVAMLTFIEAVRRLGAFTVGSFLALAPMLAASLAVPILDEPLTIGLVLGLLGMVTGALQPWRLLTGQSTTRT